MDDKILYLLYVKGLFVFTLLMNKALRKQIGWGKKCLVLNLKVLNFD